MPYKLPPIKLTKTKLCTHIPIPLNFHNERAKTKSIYLYSTNFKKLNFKITKSDFINVEYETDEINVYPKIKVSINWDLLSEGNHEGEIIIKDSKKNETKLIVKATKENLSLGANVHYQTDNYFSIKATDFDRITQSQDEKSCWGLSNGLGRKSSVLTFSGEKQENFTLSATAAYKLYFTQTGTYKGEIFRLPSLNEGNTDFVENTCKLAIGIDEKIKILHGQAKSNSVLQKGTKEIKQWFRNVFENAERLEFEFEIKEVGLHEVTVYGLDSDISFEKIVLYTGDKLSSYFGM